MTKSREVIERVIESAAIRQHGEDFKRQNLTEHSSQTVPMTYVIETVTGTVGITIELGEILENIAAAALYNKTNKASQLSGKIRAQVMTSSSETRREPTPWAEEGGDS